MYFKVSEFLFQDSTIQRNPTFYLQQENASAIKEPVVIITHRQGLNNFITNNILSRNCSLEELLFLSSTNSSIGDDSATSCTCFQLTLLDSYKSPFDMYSDVSIQFPDCESSDKFDAYFYGSHYNLTSQAKMIMNETLTLSCGESMKISFCYKLENLWRIMDTLFNL